jgi:hypothetical protein
MKNRLALVILLGLFITLAVLVALTGQPTSDPSAITATPAGPTPTPEFQKGSLLRIFPDLRVLDIQAIRLEDLSTGSQLTLLRDEQGNWTAPDLNDPLDETAASNIARTLVLLPYGRSINILPETDFKDYGLAPTPHLLFQILKVDGESHVIAVGSLTETEAAYYTLVDERDEIFQVERGAADFLKNQIGTPPIRLTN